MICSTHKIRFAGRHIKSYQDHKGVLPIEILLNERCDEIAKGYVRMATEEGSTAGTAVASPQDTCTLYIKESMVTNKFRKRLLVAALEDNLRTHMERKYGWTAETFNLIDWDHLGYAMERSYHKSKHSYARTVKFQFDIQNTISEEEIFNELSTHSHRFRSMPMLSYGGGNNYALIPMQGCCPGLNSNRGHQRSRGSPAEETHATGPVARHERRNSSLHLRISEYRVYTFLYTGLACIFTTNPNRLGSLLQRPDCVCLGSVMADIYATSGEIGYSESRRRFVLTLIEHLWKMYANLWIKRSEKLHDDTDINALTTEELNRRIQFFSTSANLFSIVEIKIGSIWDWSIHYGWTRHASKTGSEHL